MRYIVAADTGGTFTDVAVYDSKTRQVRYGKTLTTYGKLVDGVLTALEGTDVSLDATGLFKHGTTHVINTFLQRTGARTALVTTEGFADLIEIARGNRPVPFQVAYRRNPPLVPRPLRFEVRERIDAHGAVVEPLDEAALEPVAQRLLEEGVEAVAVSFLNAYANPIHEERAALRLGALLPGIYVTCGTSLTREWFEYERTSTAIANAYVGSRMNAYMRDFDAHLKARGFSGRLYMMGSNGGVLSVDRAIKQPVALVESGPVGGCIAAAAYARAQNRDRVIAFDMGGTTAKCALIDRGQFDVQPIYYVGGYERGFPLKVGVLDIVEVGTGGGSIASVDAHGALTVGPRSAGSEPGPAGFGRGGVEPTVTDACMVLGHIGSGPFVGGTLQLDFAAAQEAVRKYVAEPMSLGGAVDRAAQGILDLATSAMAGAIKEITIERGLDTRDFTLCVFGGSGPLFGSRLARMLHIPTVVVPPHPGNFATLGMLIAGARVDLSRTLVGDLGQASLRAVDATFLELEGAARQTIHAELGEVELEFEHWLEARYRGQTHTVRIAYLKQSAAPLVIHDFESTYGRRFGHTNPGNQIEILGVRLGAEAEVPRPELASLVGVRQTGEPKPAGMRSVYCDAAIGRVDAQVWRREELPAGFTLHGPAVIEEYSATTILLPGDVARVNALGEIVITFGATQGALP